MLGSKTRSSNTNQERLKRHSLKLTRPISMVVAKIDPKKNLDRILQCDYLVIANTKDIETPLVVSKKFCISQDYVRLLL